MTNVEYQARILSREIRKSNVYNQYRRLQRKLSQDRHLYHQLGEFRKAWFLLQNKAYSPEDAGALSDLRRQYESLLENADVREFLSAEQSLCAMLSQVNTLLYKSLDVDVSFLKD